MISIRLTMLPVLVGVGLVVGCQSSRPLLPVGQTRPAPISPLEFDSKSPGAEIANVAGSNRAETPGAMRGADPEPVPVEEADKPSAWSKLWERFSPPQRIPLPRTDGEDAAE